VAFWFALGLEEVRDSEPVAEVRWEWRLVGVGLLLALLAVAGWAGWTALGRAAQPAVDLPVYPGAEGLSVRTQSPPGGSDWAGPLAITTFTTTHPLTDVVGFYSAVLTEGGWVAEVEGGDEGSWGGVWVRDGGGEVCLVNVFDIEGEVWVSVVCGEKRSGGQ